MQNPSPSVNFTLNDYLDELAAVVHRARLSQSQRERRETMELLARQLLRVQALAYSDPGVEHSPFISG